MKFKWGLVLTIFLLVSGFSIYYLRSNIYHLELLSPLGKSTRPDLSQKLSLRVTQMGQLNFSTAKTLVSISDQISYLAYNPKTLKVYSAKNQNVVRAPGSFAKLLTAQVVLDLMPASQPFTVSATAADREPTILGLKPGEKLTVSELVRGAISTSANDAAAVLGEGVSAYYRQDPTFFPELMNQKAALLNLNSSHFANPEGYDDDDQYTTLVDVAKLVNNVQTLYPDIVSAGAADRVDLAATSTHGFYYLPNWNGLLGIYPTVNGLKIAYTEKAGYSTIVTAARNAIPVVAIVAGAGSIRERDLAAAALLDEAYMQERLAPVKVRAEQVNRRYHQWAVLAEGIRAELKTLGQSTPSAAPTDLPENP